MTLYTVMPLELVFAQSADAQGSFEMESDGRRLLVRRDGQGYSVVRLLSTDPADFLDPRWQPGTALPMQLQ